jgi:AcrR family transcriptional regulator
MAEHGLDGVSLRDIARVANVQVAAVSYHFGSEELLQREAVDGVVIAVRDQQLTALTALDDGADVWSIADAWARPVLATLREGSSVDRAFARVVARASGEPNAAVREAIFSQMAVVWDRLHELLRAALPVASEADLRLRQQCAAGMTQNLTFNPSSPAIDDRVEDNFVRLLAAVFAAPTA